MGDALETLLWLIHSLTHILWKYIYAADKLKLLDKAISHKIYNEEEKNVILNVIDQPKLHERMKSWK